MASMTVEWMKLVVGVPGIARLGSPSALAVGVAVTVARFADARGRG